MAEVVGLITGVAGLTPLVAGVVGGIRRLRRIRKDSTEIPEGLDALIRELELLQAAMTTTNTILSTFGADHCHESITAVVKGIEELLDKFPLKFISSGKKPKLKEAWDLRHWKEDVESLQKTVNKAKQDLSFCLHVNLSLSTIQANNIEISSSSEASSSSSSVTESEALSSFSPIKYTPPRRIVRQDCTIKACSCSCHRISRISRRFWALDYTGLFPPGNKCDQPTCTASAYGFRLRVALSQLGIPWSVTMGLRLLAGIGSFSIQPALLAERVVPYTSPGFEIIWRFKHRFMNADEACMAFRKLAQEDPSLHLHVDPSGSSFLINCVKWSYNNAHVVLLETALESGFDPTAIDSPHFSEWLESGSPLFSEWSESHSPYMPTPRRILDPFFLQLLTLVCKNNQGFAGMTPLHEAVLFGQPEDVHHWAKRSGKNERNFLGQTPLHLAVSKPQHLQAILDADHDPDATDAYGLTPLMYSAASNAIGAARILIRAGADPFMRHHMLDFTFTSFAVARCNWDFIMELFSFFDDEAMHITSEVLAQQAVSVLFLNAYRPRYREGNDCLLHLLSRCKSLNFGLKTLLEIDHTRIVEGRTLLHYASSVNDVDALLDHSSSIINQVDQKGQHALMRAVARAKLSDLEPLIRRLLDAGADINLQDNRGHTACHIMMQRLSQCASFATKGNLDFLHALVALGADALRPDNCKCSCSVSGCLPTVPDLPKMALSPRQPAGGSVILLVEWIILILETYGIETANQTLLATIRQAEHKKLDMTHTCCQWRAASYLPGDHYPDPMPEDDINEILEEESDFNKILDDKMEHKSEREFNSLLRSAILDTKPPIDQTIQQPLIHTYFFTMIPSYEGYHVDRENDRFVPEGKPHPPDAPIRGNVIIGIALYALWLEKKFRKGISEQMKVNSWRVCYLRRLSWLYYICSIMEVSTEELVEEFRHQAADHENQSDEKKAINGDVQHFCQSWEEWGAKGPAMGVDSTDGFADWPFEKESD
ncbi:Hypothetical protein NCS54_00324100 [Fusarium falciforme]|uniref:Hypothetical protein n=1 Tax=Fusarium falciforme TaxID=195108 RepID=UPI00230024EB|nr:Hypothetical protein NCS54_00324100 [Fusarium falciforme]WAO85987.1 Hypothetical protein NCS54_00324100 [Fusarium falciforme]